MKYLWLIAALFVTSAHAYTAQELREDCQAADDFFAHKGQLTSINRSKARAASLTWRVLPTAIRSVTFWPKKLG
jgi:hypothetical protein